LKGDLLVFFIAFEARGVRVEQARGKEQVVAMIQTSIRSGNGPFLLCLAFWALGGSVIAASGDVDPAFDAGSRVDESVSAIQVQRDGKILIGGAFTTVRGLSRNGLARLNADGSGDSSFDPADVARMWVHFFTLQANGKLMVRGSYARPDRTYEETLVRLDQNGRLDPTFRIKYVPNSPSETLATPVRIQPDGRVLVVYRGEERSRVIRLEADGALDGSFRSSETARFIGSMELQSDGKVLVSSFGFEGDRRKFHIVRLESDGSLDTAFQVDTNLTNRPLAQGFLSAIPQGNGKVLVWARHSDLDLMRLNGDGSVDTNFSNFKQGRSIDVVTVEPEGTILLATASGVTRLDANGNLLNTSSSICCSIEALASQADGKVIIGGSFTTVGGISLSSVARLNPDGTPDLSFSPSNGLNEGVGTMTLQADGKVLIGGGFSAVGTASRKGIARLNREGSLDPTFKADLQLFVPQVDPPPAIEPLADTSGFPKFLPAARSPESQFALSGGLVEWPPSVGSIAVRPNGKILILGGFTHVDGFERRGLAQLNPDGTLDPTFKLSNPIGFEPGGVVLQPDGKILFGGVRRLNPDGSLDVSFASSESYPAPQILLQPDEKILMAAYIGRLLRLNRDGSLDRNFNAPPVKNLYNGTQVSCLALQPDGKILIGGNFQLVGEITRQKVARLNSNGSLDLSFDTQLGLNDDVFSMLLQPDGKIVIGGTFSVNDMHRGKVARLNGDGSLDPSFSPGSAIGSANRHLYVRCMLRQPNGDILVGGNFPSFNGVARAGIVKLFGDAPVLSISRLDAERVRLRWPILWTGFMLQESEDVTRLWNDISEMPFAAASDWWLDVRTTNTIRAYRLKRDLDVVAEPEAPVGAARSELDRIHQ
jgi:uncharacterized delta-60 repeat protein